MTHGSKGIIFYLDLFPDIGKRMLQDDRGENSGVIQNVKGQIRNGMRQEQGERNYLSVQLGIRLIRFGAGQNCRSTGSVP